MKHFFSLILFFSCVNLGMGQWNTVPNPPSESISLHSQLNNRTYKISIGLPTGYTPTKKYPVFYLLDAYYAFPLAFQTMKLLNMGGEVKEFILVGIAGNETNDYAWLVNRWTDYTFTALPATDKQFSTLWNIQSPGLVSGGGEQFYQVLTQELIPLIDSKFSTTQERALSGHSLSGLFVAHILFKSDGIFSKFGINSPSFQMWSNDIFSVESNFRKQHDQLPAKVFLSIGQFEGEKDKATLREFEALIVKYPGIQSSMTLFTDESHVSVIPAMISRTMRVLYSNKN